MGTKSVTNQGLTADPNLIIVELSYDRKVILPIEEGFQLLKILAAGVPVEKKYNEPLRIKKDLPKYEFEIISTSTFKQLNMEELLED